jgi:hypothetical protein
MTFIQTVCQTRAIGVRPMPVRTRTSCECPRQFPSTVGEQLGYAEGYKFL